MTTADATVIYHGNCPDGFTGAWLLHRHLTGHTRFGGRVVNLHAGSYGETPPDVTGTDCYIVDFCYEPEHLERLYKEAQTLTILDHHQTALDWVTEFRGDQVVTRWEPELAFLKDVVVLDQSHSGAMLAMLWTRQQHNFVKYIQDRDLWQFRYGPITKDVFAAITSYPYTLENWDLIADTSVADLVIEGAAVSRYRDNLINQVLKEAYTDTLLGYDDIWHVASPYAIGSDVAGELAKRDPFRFAAYYVDKPDNIRRWGLRSTDSGLDVAVLAATRGGGGHKHASGFETPR
jgi:uncharacterized protein